VNVVVRVIFWIKMDMRLVKSVMGLEKSRSRRPSLGGMMRKRNVDP
jgi:hypothetical protein